MLDEWRRKTFVIYMNKNLGDMRNVMTTYVINSWVILLNYGKE